MNPTPTTDTIGVRNKVKAIIYGIVQQWGNAVGKTIEEWTDLIIETVESKTESDAVAFAEWMSNKYWHATSDKQVWERKSEFYPPEYATTSELYKLFKDGK